MVAQLGGKTACATGRKRIVWNEIRLSSLRLSDKLTRRVFPLFFFDNSYIFVSAFLDVHHPNDATGLLDFCDIVMALLGAFEQRLVFSRNSGLGLLLPSNTFGLHFPNACVSLLGVYFNAFW